jgi:calcium-dependent protein kinase
MLLCGEMPFVGKKRRHVIDRIMRCDYNFNSRRFKNVSKEAKKFCAALIETDPEKRLSADAALKHPWMDKNFDIKERGPGDEVMGEVSMSLKKFGEYGKFQKMALMVVAHQSNMDEIVELRKAFDQFDTANNGTIQFGEFKKALQGTGHYKDDEITKMFQDVDIDGSGVIHYTEFLAATLEARGTIEEERLAEAFDRLDSDDSGYITKKNLKDILGTQYSKTAIDEIMKEADKNNDGKICFDEFVDMFRKQTELQKDLAKPVANLNSIRVDSV